MIAKLIYEGKTAEELEISEISYKSRKETLDLFLATNPNLDCFEIEFERWVKTTPIGQAKDTVFKDKVKDHEPTPPKRVQTNDLTYGEMFTDLTHNIASIIKSGIKVCSVEEHTKRFSICKECEWLTKFERCKKCGCFMKLKSKFKAMDCPIRKW